MNDLERLLILADDEAVAKIKNNLSESESNGKKGQIVQLCLNILEGKYMESLQLANRDFSLIFNDILSLKTEGEEKQVVTKVLDGTLNFRSNSPPHHQTVTLNWKKPSRISIKTLKITSSPCCTAFCF